MQIKLSKKSSLKDMVSFIKEHVQLKDAEVASHAEQERKDEL